MPLHRLTRSTTHSLTRWHSRLSPGARRPDYLREALTAFKSAIRIKRRLMRLAPSLFDVAVMEREDLHFADTADWNRKISAEIAKVYQVPLDQVPLASPSKNRFWCRKGEEKVKRWETTFDALPPSQREAITAAMDQHHDHLAAAREALARFRHLRPHQQLSIHRIAELITVGITLGRLATGRETTQSTDDEPYEPAGAKFQRDLDRIYKQPSPTPSDQPSPNISTTPAAPTTASPQTPPPTIPGPQSTTIPNSHTQSPPTTSPPPTTSTPPVQRRPVDAYARAARYYRAMRQPKPFR